MSEENEKYPKIVLGTDGVFQIFISKGVEVKFDSEESLNEFIKDKNFCIVGIKDDRIDDYLYRQKHLIWRTLESIGK